MSFGDSHIGVKHTDGILHLENVNKPPVNRHRPSVDYLFQSGAKLKRTKIVAIILTGMGADGANGLKMLLDNKAFTMAQDEASCIVFGMPKEAIKLGAALYIGNLQEIRSQLHLAIGNDKKSKKEKDKDHKLEVIPKASTTLAQRKVG